MTGKVKSELWDETFDEQFAEIFEGVKRPKRTGKRVGRAKCARSARQLNLTRKLK